MPSLLPNIDYLIYYDVDFVCLGDVAELWALRNDHVALMCTLDNWPLTTAAEKIWFEKNGRVYDEKKYFCAGFCFFNLKRLRDEHLDATFKAIITKNAAFPAVDQSVLNLAFVDRDDLKIISSRWQTFTRSVATAAFGQQPMLHYAGEAPWVCFRKNKIFNEASLFWFRYYAKILRIPLREALRRFYSPFEIIAYRLGYLLFSRSKALQRVLYFYFHKIGHLESTTIFRAFLHRVKYPKISAAT